MANDYRSLYMFPGGTPTLGARQLTENARQYDSSLRDAQEARRAQELQAAKDRQLQQRQWEAEYQLKKQQADYDTGRPYNSNTAEEIKVPTVNPFTPAAATNINSQDINSLFNSLTEPNKAPKTTKYVTPQYTTDRLDNYIQGVRKSQKTADAAVNFIKNNKNLNPAFRQAVLERLNAYIIYD